MNRPIRVCHVITSLEPHGAQGVLLNLLSAIPRDEFESEVVSLTDVGSLGRRLRAMGLPVQAMHLNATLPNPMAVRRLARRLRNGRFDVVQTWLYHANLLGGLAARLAGRLPVVWGIHHARITRACMKLRTRCVVKMCSMLSRWTPAATVYVARSALEHHRDRGFSARNVCLIPNGIDTTRFSPAEPARASLRQRLGLAPHAQLVGHLARFVPEKDHATFVEAARLLHRGYPHLTFVLCGPEVTWKNTSLVRLLRAAGIERRSKLLGSQDDVAQLLPGLDCVVSSSVSEAFPLVLVEAMACAVPCITTDVGDCARIVGQTGRVVPPRDPSQLAGAIREVLELAPQRRAALGRAARQRVLAHYSLEAAVAAYAEVWRNVAALRRGGSRAAAASRPVLAESTVLQT